MIAAPGQVHNFSYGAFTWWVGVVEDRAGDPLKLGRVKARIFGYHSPDKGEVPTEDLPWATVMLPINSATLKGTGQSPVGILDGTHVVGFFADGVNAQAPIIIGTLPGNTGDIPDTNNLTRGEKLGETVIAEKKSDLLTSKVGNGGFGGIADMLAEVESITESIEVAAFEIKANIDAVINMIPTDIGSLSNISSLAGFASTDIGGELTSALSGIQSQIALVQGFGSAATAEAFAAKAQLESMVFQYKSQVQALQNLVPNAVGDLTSMLGGLDSIMSAGSQLGKIQSAVQAIGKLGGAVSAIKSLAQIPGLGAAVSSLINSLIGGALSNTWDEPPTPAAPNYPLNDVRSFEGGHIEEWDNTPGKERYHRYHPTGTFKETHPDGTSVEKIVKDRYTITMGNDFVHVDGDVKVNIVGTATIAVGGDCALTVEGNFTQTVNGDASLAVGGDYSVVVGGSHSQKAGSHFVAQAPRIDLNF